MLSIFNELDDLETQYTYMTYNTLIIMTKYRFLYLNTQQVDVNLAIKVRIKDMINAPT